MYVQTGKTFVATLIAVVLALGGLAWLSSGGHKDVPATLAQTHQIAQTPATQSAAAYESSSNATGSSSSSYEDGYRAGYRDGHQDCATTQNTSVARSSSVARSTRSTPRYSAPRARVAGARYYAEPRKDHSTRNLILTIAGPAAVGAGIGAIARGGKGAGIGALLGGGGGALYHLYKNRRRR
ncbi:MAG: hypothetical protein AABN33_13990 [Acidobacteriota bacterium]